MSTSPARFQNLFLLALVIAISLLFLLMIRGLLMPVFLAAIFTGLTLPVYQRITDRMGGRRNTAAIVTLLLVLLVIVIPLTLFAGIVAQQAVNITDEVRPIIEQQVTGPQPLSGLIDRFPILQRLQPYEGEIMSRIGALAGRTGTFLVNSLAAATVGTVHFIFGIFIMLYAMFFFLRDGKSILQWILYLMPLTNEAEQQMVSRFVSVTRATLKGTLIIGIVQGALAGGAFWVAGIQGSAFWGTVMAVLSIIPGVGTALVWVPAVILMGATGRVMAAVLVAVWCAVVVGTADNFLRPTLVGRDTEMSDLMILLSTLGGLVMFGAAGIIVGPIIAALFVTAWDLYATAFSDLLPETESGMAGSGLAGEAGA